MSSAIVTEEERALAFMDIMPARKGHVLIIPKAHAEGMLDVSEEDLLAVMRLVRKVSRAMKESLGPAGFSVLQLNGAASGQTVFHIHFHVIPRRPGDGLAMKWSHETYASGEMEQYREKIANGLQQQR